tara:strand:- start:181 stop:564 length:384 start_codon:yes stop_codon:yes gene_type:complete
MRTREERQADRQARRQERRANRGEVINDLFNTVTGQTPPPPPVPETPVQETPVVDPRQQELDRQAREVMSGNVNSAQAEYFRQQNEDLFSMKARKGANTLLNPVSNRTDGMTDVYANLYGSEESRGF